MGAGARAWDRSGPRLTGRCSLHRRPSFARLWTLSILSSAASLPQTSPTPSSQTRRCGWRRPRESASPATRCFFSTTRTLTRGRILSSRPSVSPLAAANPYGSNQTPA